MQKITVFLTKNIKGAYIETGKDIGFFPENI